MKAQHTEIERRFLVRRGATQWRERAQPRHLVQGYLSTEPQRVVRVRIDGDAAFLTVKGRATAGARAEIETPIAPDVARAVLEHPAQLCVGTIIDKTRWTFRDDDGLVWEIDEFAGRNGGLVVAEVEYDGSLPLDEWNARVDAARHPWLGAEVTGRSRYSNSSLTMRPFDEWSDEERALTLEGG